MEQRPASEQEQAPDDDFDFVAGYRFRQARQYGLNRKQAREFARGTQPITLLRRLSKLGCPIELRGKITL